MSLGLHLANQYVQAKRHCFFFYIGFLIEFFLLALDRVDRVEILGKIIIILRKSVF